MPLSLLKAKEWIFTFYVQELFPFMQIQFLPFEHVSFKAVIKDSEGMLTDKKFPKMEIIYAAAAFRMFLLIIAALSINAI